MFFMKLKNCKFCNGFGATDSVICKHCNGTGFSQNKIKFKDLERWIVKKTQDMGFSTIIEDSEFVTTNGIQCSGFFSSEGKCLVVAKKSPYYEIVLIHEFHHFQQYISNNKMYFDCVDNGLDLCGVFDDFLLGKIQLEESTAREYAYKIGILELDCEIRTIETLRKLGHSDEDLQSYKEKSISYARLYMACAERKKWRRDGITIMDFKWDLYKNDDINNFDYRKPLTEEENRYFDRVF